MATLNMKGMFDREFSGYMDQCAQNIVREVMHLKEFLADKDESYIRSNPEEVACEIMSSGVTAMHCMGAYTALDGIRETGFVPRITFRDEELEAETPDNTPRKVYDNAHKYDLDDFDPECYKISVEAFAQLPKIDRKNELDLCSELITAMVRNGAMKPEIEQVVKYSMVVIDTDKKKLNWQEAKDYFFIDKLKEKYLPDSASKT